MAENRKNRDREYYEKNKANINKRNNEYYEKNKEKIRAKRKQYYEENRARINEQQRARFHNNIQVKLGSAMRNRARKEIGIGKIYLKLLGCSYAKFMKWFEFNFELDGNVFNWWNHGSVWQIDHVRPIKIYDMTNKRDIKICFNWKNTMPVYASYNHRKNGSIVKEDILKVRERVKLFKQKISNGDIVIDDNVV